MPTVATPPTTSKNHGCAQRAKLRPETLAKALADEVHKLDYNFASGEVIIMQEQIDRATAGQRASVAMLGVSGGLALLLAAIGLYGVMSNTVLERTRELGLRMAFGARTSDLLGQVMSQWLALTCGGVVLGAAASLVLTLLIVGMLYHVSPRDPLAFVIASIVMVIVSMTACASLAGGTDKSITRVAGLIGSNRLLSIRGNAPTDASISEGRVALRLASGTCGLLQVKVKESRVTRRRSPDRWIETRIE